MRTANLSNHIEYLRNKKNSHLSYKKNCIVYNGRSVWIYLRLVYNLVSESEYRKAYNMQIC